MYAILQCLGPVVLKNLLRMGGNLVGGGLVPLGDIAVEGFDVLRKRSDEKQLLAEVAKIARDGGEYRRQVAELVRNLTPGQPEHIRQALATYLAQVPGKIKRSLKSANDPTGTTVPPGMALRKAGDLRKLLPERLARFRPGDRPLPGKDLVLEELLGTGGFGEVWRARHEDRPDHPKVALKFCLDAAASASLRNEVRLLDRVAAAARQEKGIVQLLDADLRSDPPYLKYEFVDGGDLGGLIYELHARGQATPERVAKIVLRLTRIIGVAHRLEPPIVHRDLKPDNILTQKTKTGLQLKVGDFGIGGIAAGQEIREWKKTTRGMESAEVLTGAHTPIYASEEQRRGEPADPKDDVYSLGVIWFQALYGDLGKDIPRGSAWKRQLVAEGVPQEMVALLEKCVEPRAGRIKDARELADRLTAILDWDTNPGAAKEGAARSRPAAKPSNNRRLVAGAGAAAVLLFITVLWAGLRPGSRARQELDLSPKNADRLSKENVDKLAAGMTLGEVEQILGPGRPATNTYGYYKQGGSWSGVSNNNHLTWNKAIEERRVRGWEGAFNVLAAFPGNPSSDSKVDVFLIQQEVLRDAAGRGVPDRMDPQYRYAKQIPPDKWEVTKDNFLKLKIGMTLKELQDVVGVGGPLGGPESFMNKGWRTAVKEYRVYWWSGEGVHPIIYAGFSEPPTAAPATKAEALSFRDGVWDQDIGALSDAKAAPAGTPPAKHLARKVGETMTDKLGMKFAWVPPGTGSLGGGIDSHPSDRKEFKLAKGLWCGVYEVTQAEWQKVMGNNPSFFKDNPRYPVDSVTWYQVLKFVEKMNREWKTDGIEYRLPSEQEWEFCCRGGPGSEYDTLSDYYFARSKLDLTLDKDTVRLSPVQARFLRSDSAEDGPRVVGSYLPNPLGIYDMHGNVQEWTSSSNPSDASERVSRGGSWQTTATQCAARMSMWAKPGDSYKDLGFRLLAVPSE